jgi:outer membrane protein TolC
VQLLSLEVIRHGYGPVLTDLAASATYTDATNQRLGTGTESVSLGVSQKLPFGGSAGVSYAHGASQVSGPDVYSGALTVTLTQPLLKGFGPRVSAEALVSAERNLAYNRRTFEFRRQSLLISIVEVYFGLLQQENSIRNFERNLENIKKQARRAQIREQFGQVTRTDVFRSQLEVTKAESSLAQAKEAVKLAQDAFKLDLGLPPEFAIALAAEVVEYHAGAMGVDEAVQLALQNNPDWLNAPLKLEDARRTLAIARNGTLPQLDLTASHTWNTTSEQHLFASYGLDSRSWSVGATMAFPIDNYVNHREYEQAVITYRQAEREFLRLRDRLVADVQGRFINLRQSELAMQFAERAIGDAEKAARLAEFDYERGLATNRDVLDAQEGLLEARNSYQAALVAARIQQFRLLQFVGKLQTDDEGNWLK